jgi:peptide-methionine (S)-S-oxide reductase
MSIEIITLGGGCFWCTEAVYEHVDGVTAVESGYCNGRVAKPTYEQVCSSATGCVEVIRVTFDADRISLREVLEIFFVIHDPTTPNRQGNDVGTQYRSGIYFHEAAQQAVAREVMDEVNAKVGGRLVTELLPLADYSRAEDYHQHYYANNPHQGYCAMVAAPKIEKFRKTFASRYR